MAWGAPRGIDDLVARVRANDAALPSLCLLPTRRFNAADAAALCEALSANTVLTDLSISSHGVPPPLAALFAGVLHTNRTLASLSLGNSTFADEVRRRCSICHTMHVVHIFPNHATNHSSPPPPGSTPECRA